MPRPSRTSRTSQEVSYLGIDPGKSGGLAWYASWRDEWECVPMPTTEKDVWDWLYSCPGASGRPIIAVIEKVHSYPGEGVKNAFAFGMGYGSLRMSLTALQVRWQEVTPQAWQKGLGIPIIKGEDRKSHKERLRAFAQRLFPRLPIWDEPKSKVRQMAICDALLICEYCRRTCV